MLPGGSSFTKGELELSANESSRSPFLVRKASARSTPFVGASGVLIERVPDVCEGLMIRFLPVILSRIRRRIAYLVSASVSEPQSRIIV